MRIRRRGDSSEMGEPSLSPRQAALRADGAKEGVTDTSSQYGLCVPTVSATHAGLSAKAGGRLGTSWCQKPPVHSMLQRNSQNALEPIPSRNQ